MARISHLPLFPPPTLSDRNERYTTRIASAKKPPSVHLSVAGLTDFYAPGISEVAEKIVFDGDGGTFKLPRIDKLLPMLRMLRVTRNYLCKYCTFATVCTSRYILWQKCSIYTKAQVEVLGSKPGYCTWCTEVLCQQEMHRNALVALPTYVAREFKRNSP